MRTLKPPEKRIAAVWSFSAVAIFGAVASFGLLASPGIPKSTADASPAVIESHSGGRSAPAPVPDVESTSPDMEVTVPGHAELTLQLD